MSDCLTYAIAYLSKYPKTIHEMRHVLTKKGFTTTQIDEAIPTLTQAGYLDDTAYAHAYLYSEVARKGKPLLIIRQKLLMKGINKMLLTDVCQNEGEALEIGQREAISKEIARLQTKGKPLPVIIQTLMRKGRTYTLIQEVVRHHDG